MLRLKLKQRRPHTCTQVHQTVMSHVDTVLQAAEPIAKAFETYANAMPNNCIFLVDTYDTVQGVRNAVQIGHRLRKQGHQMIGVRLDSGDMADLSKKARAILDEGGFPDAKIVHCKRSPLDTCLSCYTNYFSSPQPFAYHVDDIAQYYLSYEALMAHWREHYPQEFVEIEYEGLVSNPDGEIPRLLEGCGLRFEQACLSPHESTAPVRTASLVQVRQPISTASMEKWRRYGSGLDPLVRALGRHNS